MGWGEGLAEVGTLVRRMEPGVVAGCSAVVRNLELAEGELEDQEAGGKEESRRGKRNHGRRV